MFLCLKGFIHAQCNICGLLVDRCDHAAGVCVKSVFSSCVSDLTDCVAHDLRDIDIRLCGDLSL